MLVYQSVIYHLCAPDTFFVCGLMISLNENGKCWKSLEK